MADSRIRIDTGTHPEKNEPTQFCARQKPSELRKAKIKQRLGLTEEQRRQKSALIAEQLMSGEVWKRAENVLIYASYGAEVSTFELIDRALLSGKNVFCPRVEGERMEFYQIFSRGDLQPGFRGILEPDGRSSAFERLKKEASQAKLTAAGQRGNDAGNALEKYKKTLLVAPGTVFDLRGHRIGYGGGYYDRYLCQFSESDRPFCIGICFSCQLADRIWPEKHDVKMDGVIFDKTPGFDR